MICLQPFGNPFLTRFVLGLFCSFASVLLQAQEAELSLIHVQLPDTVVLGDTIVVSAYLKNNAPETYANANLDLSFYVNEVQDVDKSAAIQSTAIGNALTIPTGDSVYIEQELVIDNLLFQIGENQNIQKNIIIVWPVDDNYSIDYHLQPLVVLKQAIPTSVYNPSTDFASTPITNQDLPNNVLEYIQVEYPAFSFNEVKQQNFNDGSLQFEVELEDGEGKVTLYFSNDGTLLLTKTESDTSILSSNIQDFIAVNYSAYTIESVYVLHFPDGTVQYIVEIEEGEDNELDLYFDESGGNIEAIGIVLELYEEPDIEIGGITLPASLELETEVSIEGTLTNNLSVPYNDLPIPINYASLPFPPTIDNPKLRTQTTIIDLIAPSETVSFQQDLSIDQELFYEGKNIVIVWPVDYLTKLTSNCIIQEVFIELPQDTVGIQLIPELSNDIVIAPNPTLQRLNIQTHQLQIEAITIYDLSSKIIANYPTILQDSFSADLSHFNKGMYLIYIQTDKGNAVKKLVKW